jgi:hypothetical protein
MRYKVMTEMEWRRVGNLADQKLARKYLRAM